ncbi:MAG: radical SAM protein [Candidatus Melainabacteria bacterium]|nr:radical SAM protein [Candidatus Melainabacteria bacterium]
MIETITKTNQKVLLLNPPGTKPYLRDYFCNNISKSKYLHYPVDLLLLTGTLKENGFEVSFLDALLKGYSQENTLEKIKQINPDYIVILIGTISWHEDKEFLEKLKTQNPNVKIIGTGDIFLDSGKESIEKNAFFDGCILDFSDNTILKLIDRLSRQGTRDKGQLAIDNCIYRDNGSGPIVGEIKRLKGEFSIPTPIHDLFPLKEYRYAFSRNFPTAHILTDFGCAFNCNFCPIRIDNLGFKVRPVEDIIKELKYLKSIGIKELYFRDQTFGANKKRALELCERIIEEDLQFTWFCFSRVDVINEELLDAMKKAGCHTIIFGIESANDKTLTDVQKRISSEKIKHAFRLCKKRDIRRAATFIIGLPGETEENIMNTVNFAIEIDCSFASFNIAEIRPGTNWSKNPDKIKFLPRNELEQIRNKVIKKFYLRPGYVFDRIKEIRTFHDMQVLLEEGLGIVANLVKS